MTSLSTCPLGVGGETDEAGEVDAEWDASGVSGIGGDGGGEMLLCSGGAVRRGAGLGGDVDGARPVTNEGAGVGAPAAQGVVEGIGEGAGEGMR